MDMDLRLTFNEDALNYDKMRPTYVKELFKDVIQFSGLNNNKSALEIGIGTGQATLPFLKTGCKVTAVEPGGELAAFTREKFSEFAAFDVINKDFESVDLDHNRFDLVYSATAFHWIPQEIGYPKVYQLLKSGGALALFWNHPFPATETDPIHDALQEIYDRYRSSPAKAKAHPHNQEKCLEMINMVKKYGFTDVSCKLYYQTRTFDAQSYVSLLNTYSDHRAMPEETRVPFEREIQNVINRFGGKLDVYDTIDLYLARKL